VRAPIRPPPGGQGCYGGAVVETSFWGTPALWRGERVSGNMRSSTSCRRRLRAITPALTSTVGAWLRTQNLPTPVMAGVGKPQSSHGCDGPAVDNELGAVDRSGAI
jgi:hypothetical protein